MTSVADFEPQRLRERGVQRAYGCPGDGVSGLPGAFDRAKGKPESIRTRHEERAAFTAGAPAEFTGEVGCCVATSGPGAVRDPEGLGIAAQGARQKVTGLVGHLPGRQP